MPDTLDYQPPPPRPRSYRREATVFAAGAVLGALIWALSRTLTGRSEAWDAFGYYFTALLISGFIAACFAPSRFWVAPIGVYFGQVAYLAIGFGTGLLPPSPLWILGAGLGLVFSFFALVGAALPGLTALLLGRFKSSRE